MSSSGPYSSSITAESFPTDRESEIPRFCSCCGSGVVIRMSRTSANPGRLFFKCPNSRGQDNSHLFKWADEAMLEEIELLTNTLSDLRIHLRQLEERRKQEREMANSMMKETQNLMSSMANRKNEVDAAIAKGHQNKHVKLTNFMLGCVVGVLFYGVLGCKFKTV